MIDLIHLMIELTNLFQAKEQLIIIYIKTKESIHTRDVCRVSALPLRIAFLIAAFIAIHLSIN